MRCDKKQDSRQDFSLFRLPGVWLLFFLTITLVTGCGSSGGSVLCAADPASSDVSTDMVQTGGNTETLSGQDAQLKGREIAVTTEVAGIYVHVCGAVKSPGLYELPENTRIGDAVDAAGGFSKDADQSSVNLAQMTEDGMQIYVCEEGESRDASSGTAGASGTGSGTSSDGLIDINTADEAALTQLSGIGDTKAKAIIDYRTEHGSFSSIEDIKNVSGIGDGTYEKIKDEIVVR